MRYLALKFEFELFVMILVGFDILLICFSMAVLASVFFARFGFSRDAAILKVSAGLFVCPEDVDFYYVLVRFYLPAFTIRGLSRFTSLLEALFWLFIYYA